MSDELSKIMLRSGASPLTPYNAPKKLDQLGGKHVATDKEIEQASRGFEEVLLKQMIDSMWSTVPKNGLISGSREEEMFQDMMGQQLAHQMAEGAGLGIHTAVAAEMRKREKR